MRGVSFWSFIGPGVSALNNWLPPTPSSGRIATASTRMPMPPISTIRQRQTLIEVGSASRPVSTVEPVVVRPDTASKYASVKLRSGKYTISGSAPKAGNTVHTRLTSRKPSRGCSSRL